MVFSFHHQQHHPLHVANQEYKYEHPEKVSYNYVLRHCAVVVSIEAVLDEGDPLTLAPGVALLLSQL